MYIKQNDEIFTITSIDMFSFIIIRCNITEVKFLEAILLDKRSIHVEL